METLDASLVRMLNQIAQNFGYLPPGEAAAETANHLRQFWTPEMLEHLAEHLEAGGGDLSPVALEAARLL